VNSKHTQKAYEFLRDKIVEGVYAPGRRLQTVELAAEINVSRTPVREALRLLQADGLVEIKAGMGASVRFIDALAFREVCELRLALESCAAELAAVNQGRGDLLDIESALEAMDRLVALAENGKQPPDLQRELVKEDIRFHFAIIRAAHNRLIKKEILGLQVLNRVVSINLKKMAEPDRYSLEVSPEQEQERRKWVLESHRRIFLGIQRRDRDEARRAMHEHISDVVERSMRVFAEVESRRDAPAGNFDETRYAPIG